jgi:hypothetical protein
MRPVGERLPVAVADDETLLAQLHVEVIDTDHGGGKRRGSDMRSGYGVRDAVPLVGRGGAADATTA